MTAVTADETTPTEATRPPGACQLCLPPHSNTRPWRQADPGYRTCGGCADWLETTLADIAERYARLDARPGRSGDNGRGSPGFVSVPPGSVHIMAMRDARSSPQAHVWMGSDGRVHRESLRPPLSVVNVLQTEAWAVAEVRGYTEAVPGDVGALCRWLTAQLDWLTRQDTVADTAHALRQLQAQLRPVTGDPRIWIATCPNTIDEGEHTRTCGNNLYAPAKSDVIRCAACDRRWPRTKWVRLGQLAQRTA